MPKIQKKKTKLSNVLKFSFTESERDWGEKRKIRVKNTIETDKEKIKKEKKDSFPV